MATIIDLTKPIQYNKNDPFYMRVKIKHKPHRKAGFLLRWFIKLPKQLFPPGFIGWADDTIKQLGVHATTHIDAPSHYSTTVNGKKAKTIDEIPLDWCYGDGCVLDFSHKPDNEVITGAEIQDALAKINVTLRPGMIVLIRTDRDQYMGQKDFPDKGTGMGAEATEWLIDQGIKVMGIDQWGWDLPLRYQAQLAKETNNPNLFWEGHLVGARKEYCHMEQLTNLKALPSSGFKVCVFPMKIVGGSAVPIRAVAILDE